MQIKTLFLYTLLALSPFIGNAQVLSPSAIDKISTEALEAYNSENWEQAYEKFQRLNYLNPTNSYYPYYLMMTSLNMDKNEESLQYALSTYHLGYRKGQSAFIAGSLYMEKTRYDSALSWFERAVVEDISAVYDLTELSTWNELSNRFPNRDLVKVVNIILNPATERNDKWKQDLFVLARNMEWAHHNVYNSISKYDWQKAIHKIEERIPDLEDHEIITEFTKLVVKVGDGHTLLVPPFSGENQFHAYPLIYYLFKDGLFVQSAAPEYEHLTGKQILKIGNKTIQELEPYVADIFSHDNSMGVKWGYSLVLQVAEYLHALGISPDKEQVTIEYKEADGSIKTTTLKNPVPIDGAKLADLLYPNKGGNDWSQMNPQNQTLPLWQQNLETPYWFTHLSNHKAIYFGFNQIQNGDQPFPEFLDDLFAEADSAKAEYLIIDLRTNEGGDLTMTTTLQKALIKHPKFSQEGNLYVLLGRETFSAAGFFAGKLDTYLNPIFVGEPMGTEPNFIGESGGVYILPNSGIYVNGSNLSWMGTFSFDKRNWIAPDILIELTSGQFANNEDPVLDAVLSWIE